MYTLFYYNENVDMYYEYKKFDTLKEAKRYVDDKRNEYYLLDKLYIRNNNRVVKCYDKMKLPDNIL